MKSGSYGSPSSGSFLNKPVLIIIAIIISSASFILGYMAGKSTMDSNENEIISIRDSEAQDLTLTEGTEPDTDEIIIPPGQKDDEVKKDMVRPSRNRHDEDITVPVKAKKVSEPAPRVFAERKDPPSKGRFTVQVGAFNTRKDADSLRLRLEKKGYNSYIEAIRAGRKDLFKVRVGSFHARDDAEDAVRSLKKIGMESFIVTKR